MGRPKYKEEKAPSELRFDLVSKDWVVIATGRAKKPQDFRKERKKQESKGKEGCPFESLDKQEAATAVFWKGKRMNLPPPGEAPKKWTAVSVLNKYPAFTPGGRLATRLEGPFSAMDGVGFHEVLITKHHTKDVPQFSLEEVKELVDLYHSRYVSLKEEELVNHITIFKNKGSDAGASLSHPHSQLIAIPIIDPDIDRSLRGSARYLKEQSKCVHCIMLDWNLKKGSRIVFENKNFAVLCPFASRVAFEVRVYPKKHSPYMEDMEEEERWAFAEALQKALSALFKGLGDPDYNYFFHTAPVNKGNYEHYHWHLEILPKTATWAGFELGTGIEISTIEPETAAAFLRKQS